MEESPATDRVHPTLFSSHLLPVATLAFCAGITAAQVVPPGESVLIPSALVVALLAIASRKIRPLRSCRPLLLISFFFLLGIIHAGPYLTHPSSPDHVANLITTRQEATVIGTIVAAPETRDDPFSGKKTKLLITAEHLLFPPRKPDRPRPPTGQKTHGRILLTLNGELDKKHTPGDRLAIRARLSPPHSFATPGAFDFTTYLARQGIRTTGWIATPANIVSLKRDSPSSVPLTTAITFSSEKIRLRIGRFIDTHLSPPASGLYRAILIGDKSGISPTTLETFVHTGTMHLLAISGLHLGVLAVFFYFVFLMMLKKSSWILLRFPAGKIAAILTLLPLTGYALIAGMNIPVARALLMAAAVILSLLLDRQKTLTGILSLAALFILIMAPQSLFTASFQLSFGAVLTIAVVSTRFPQLLNFTNDGPTSVPWRTKLRNRLLSGVLLSILIVMGIAPILAYHFHRISLLGPLATIIIEPLLCLWSLTIGLGAIFFMELYAPLASLFLRIGSLGLLASKGINDWLTHILPHASPWIPAPTYSEILLYYLFLFALLALKKKNRIALALLCVLAVFIQEASIQAMRSMSKKTTVSFLDVGHGSATLLEFPHGHTVLVDGGGPTSSRLNVGRDILAPYLWKKRILTLDGIVITHPHADHFNGLEFIIEHFKPKTFWTNGEPSANRDFVKLLEKAAQMEVEQKVAGEQSVLARSGNTTLICISAPGGNEEKTASGNTPPARVYEKETNRNSLVLLLENDNARYIFPGDIDAVTEKHLIDLGSGLKADVLLSPHHGSTGSNSDEFLKAVAPKHLIVSSGSHLPGSLSAQRLRELDALDGAALLFTAQDGTIRCSDESGALRCSGYTE